MGEIWIDGREGSRIFDIEVSAGRIPHSSVVHKFGRNPDVDGDEDVWSAPTADWVAPTAAAIHNIVSTDANDDGDPVGSGARTIEIQGLDANFVFQKEPLTLNGTTDVPSTKLYTRIFRMKCLTFGTTGWNEGTITATATSPSATTVTAQIEIKDAQTLMAIYTVPSGCTGYMTQYYASINKVSGSSAGTVDVGLFFRERADETDAGWVLKHIQGLNLVGSSRFDFRWKPTLQIPEKTDVKLRALNNSANNLDLSAGFSLILELTP